MNVTTTPTAHSDCASFEPTKFEGKFGRSFRFSHANWTIDVAAFTFSAPARFKDLTAWRYRLSKNAGKPGPWRDKNPYGESFTSRCFHSVHHARKAAMQAAREAR